MSFRGASLDKFGLTVPSLSVYQTSSWWQSRAVLAKKTNKQTNKKDGIHHNMVALFVFSAQTWEWYGSLCRTLGKTVSVFGKVFPECISTYKLLFEHWREPCCLPLLSFFMLNNLSHILAVASQILHKYKQTYNFCKKVTVCIINWLTFSLF